MIEVSVTNEVGPVAPEWDALAERLGAGPFLSPDWIAAHWSAFGAGVLTIVAVRRDGALGAVLPLARRARTARSVTNVHSPQFGILSEGPELTAYALRAVTRLGISRLALSYLDHADPLISGVRDHARAHGRLLVERVMLRSPYIELNRAPDEYWARLRRSFVADLHRRNRRLSERGQIQLDVRDGSSELDALLAEGWRVERSGWKGSGGTAVTASPSTEHFYREVAYGAARRQWLRLYFLRFDDNAIAFSLGLAHGGVLYLLKAGYDPAYAKFSPGQLLQQRVIEHAYAAGLTRIELLGADEPYKLRWTDKRHERVSLQWFAPSAARRIQWATCAYGRPLAVRVGLDRASRPLRYRSRAVLEAARARTRPTRSR